MILKIYDFNKWQYIPHMTKMTNILCLKIVFVAHLLSF